MNSDRTYTQNSLNQVNARVISRMINSVLFFLDYIFILKESGEYRLVITHNQAKLHDLRYKTLRGARVACAKLIAKKRFKNQINPDWSFFYQADKNWVLDKLKENA